MDPDFAKTLARLGEAIQRFAEALKAALEQMAQALHELALKIFPAYAAAVRRFEAEQQRRAELGWRYDIWKNDQAFERRTYDDSRSKVPYDLRAETVWFWRRWVR